MTIIPDTMIFLLGVYLKQRVRNAPEWLRLQRNEASSLFRGAMRILKRNDSISTPGSPCLRFYDSITLDRP